MFNKLKIRGELHMAINTMMNGIDMRKISFFLAAVEEKSFSKASQKQNVSQPSITFAINEIEDVLQKPLFQRSGKIRTAKLTPEGKRTAEHFYNIFDNYQQEMIKIANLNENNQFKIYVQSGLSDFISAKAISEMSNITSNYNFSVVFSDRRNIERLVLSNKYSMGILLNKPLESEFLHSRRIASNNYNLIVPDTHYLYNTKDSEFSWGDIPENTVIWNSSISEINRSLKIIVEKSKISLDNFMQTNSLALLRRMLEDANRPILVMDKLFEQQPFDWNYVKKLSDPLYQVSEDLDCIMNRQTYMKISRNPEIRRFFSSLFNI